MPKKILTPKQMESRARFAADRVRSLERMRYGGKEKDLNDWKMKAYESYMALAEYVGKKPFGKKKAEEYIEKAQLYTPISPLKKGMLLERLVRKTSPAFSIFFLAVALVLIIFNLTGYAIGGVQESLRFAGVISFLAGLIFAFLYLKSRND